MMRSSKRRYVIVGSAVLAALFGLAVLFAQLAAMFRSQPVPSGLAQCQLDDGSVVVLRQVTVGTRHAVELPVGRRTLTSLEVPTGRFSDRTEHPGMVVWLSRHDPQTGAPLDFAWLSHAEVSGSESAVVTNRRNETGWEATGDEGKSSESSPTPGPVTGIPKQSLSLVVQHVTFPLIASSTPLTCRLIDQSGQVAGEFPIASRKSMDGLAQWQARDFPQTESDEDLEVTLTGFSVRSVKTSRQFFGGVGDIVEHYVEPDYEFRLGGQPGHDWQVISTELRDTVGNAVSVQRCDLPVEFGVWKLRLGLLPSAPDAVDPDRSVVLPPLAFPENGETKPVDMQAAAGSLKLKFVSSGRGGTCEHTLQSEIPHLENGKPARSLHSHRGGSLYSYLNETNGLLYSVKADITEKYDPSTKNVTMTIVNLEPHLVVQHAPLGPGEHLLVFAQTESGSAIRAFRHPIVDGSLLVFLPEADSGLIEITLSLEPVRVFEFTVPPLTAGYDLKTAPQLLATTIP